MLYLILLGSLAKKYRKGGNIMPTNNDIRTRATAKGVRLWQIADKLNITDGNFS